MRAKGHKNQGVAAYIPKQQVLRASLMRVKGNKHEGMAADVP